MNNKKLTRGLRNCNPGNIRIGRDVWAGQIFPGSDKEFCQFRTMAYGYRALLKLLRNYNRYHGCRTISDYIRRWAPPTENNTSAYLRSVCLDMQVPDSYVPDINHEDTMCALAAAISRVENGIPAVMEDVHQGWKELYP